MVICRVPEGRSIVFPSSRCPRCGAPIRFYDNIPIVSYILLRAECRRCRGAISARYPLIELATALLSAGTFHKFGMTPAFVVFFGLCAALVAVFWIDLDHMIIPDSISLNGIPVGMAAAIAGFIPDVDWLESIAGLLLGGAILYFPAVIYERLRGIEGLGGGDIKLLAMIGTFIGPHGVVFVLTISSLLGSMAGLAGIVFRGASTTTQIPFGPFLVTGVVTYVFAGTLIVDMALQVLAWCQVFLLDMFASATF